MVSDLLFSANVVVPIFLLIMLGYVLTRLKLWDEHFLNIANMLRNMKFSVISVLGKIVLLPAIMLPISAALGFNRLEMAILLAVFATPNAVSSYAMARNYEADHELAGEIITLGTLFSIVTIFIFITLSKSLGWI